MTTTRTKPDMPAITKKLYEVLEQLDTDTRKRAIAATMAMLGQDVPEPAAKETSADDVPNPTRGTTWKRQNSVTPEQLAHVFQGIEIIASTIPGANKREKTINTYILTGIAQLLETGESRFSDEAARQACEQHGCYDSNNHSQTINKKRGNAFTGSVKAGWQLTTPGSRTGANLVKQIAGA